MTKATPEIKSIEFVIARLRKRINYWGGQTHLAKRIGCTPTFISLVLHGERAPGDKLLKELGFRKVTAYEEIE